MNLIQRYKDEYNELGGWAKLIHNSLYALSLIIWLYPTGVYDSYYRNYVKSRVTQHLTLPNEINTEGMLWLTVAAASTVSPGFSSSSLQTSISLDNLCNGVVCQIWVLLCTSSKENFNTCAWMLASSISE